MDYNMSTLEKIFRESVNISDEEAIDDNMAPGITQGWDSLSNMELIGKIEEVFGFTFEFEELMEINSWKTLKETVLKKANLD
jgi:acyl carrier protein